jgi:hypothetical protein
MKSTDETNVRAAGKAPWHLWVVGILALVWNGSGAYTILKAQNGKLAGLSMEEAGYYAAQSQWFVIVTDIALFGAIAAAIALLLRSRFAVHLFALSLACIVITDVYDLSMGTSRALANGGATIVTAIIAVVAVLELAYARSMKRGRILR